MDNTVGSLTQVQKSLIEGSLLGDGCLRIQGKRVNALFEVNHTFKQKEYVDWKYELLKNIVITPPKPRKGKGVRIAYRFTTRSVPVLTEYHKKFYQNKKKIIPDCLFFTPLLLAVWFMDDGSKSRSSFYLNTQQFCIADQIKLQETLNAQWSIKTSLNKDKKYYRIRIRSEDALKFRSIVKPYILPIFNYKLAL